MTEHKNVPARSSHVPKRVLGFVALIVLAGLLLIVSHTNAFKLATTHQPERFTELYFTRPDALPTSAKSGSIVPVSFTLHNQEAGKQTYSYAITFTDPTSTTMLSQQRVTLQDGEQKAITQNVTLPDGDAKGELVVTLVGKNQTIHFWVERSL